MTFSGPAWYKLSLALVTFFSFSSDCFGQWEWLNPKPSGFTCSKIIFTDNTRGFILNSNGDLLITIDQGAHWDFKQNFPYAVALDMKDSTGVICGYNGAIYISTDNGNSWEMKNAGTSAQLTRADIVNRDTIFLTDNGSGIYRSDDGGNSWHSFNCGIQISSFDFASSKVVYVGGAVTYILKTVDGGATWQPSVVVNVIPSNTMSIKFIDANTGFAFREHSELLSTTDGGITWKSYNIGDDIYSLYFINKTTGFACGQDGATYRTDDAGATWNWIGLMGRIDDYDLNSVYFFDSNTGFAVGMRGRILKTTDGGLTWTTFSPTYLDVGDMSIPTSHTAYATVGNTIFKTIDAGQTWKQLNLTVGTNYDAFQYCSFFNADTGFVTASHNARVYKTYDGGTNWKEIAPAPYSYDAATCLQFINRNTGFLALYVGAYGGTIVKTQDAGDTWTTVWSSQYYGEMFHKIFFIDEKIGYASRNEILFKTEDSAKTWTKLWGEEFNDISSIWFVNPQTGFVVGNNGMVKRTNDSGKSWAAIPVTPQYLDDIYAIRFFNEQVGYITTENGVVYKTADGGNNWSQAGKIFYYRMNSIRISQDSSVYLAGQYGSIVRSDVRQFTIDPITLTTQNCNAKFSSTVTAVLSSVDSISFEYGINNFDQTARASPSTINNTRQTVTASVDLLHSTQYKVRLKLYYRGQYHYGDEYTFITLPVPQKPVISNSGNVLSSSAIDGNQWYLDGVIIPGATSSTFTPTSSGQYTVKVTLGGCASEFSDPFSFIVTSVNPPEFERQILINPNPVSDQLYVKYSGNSTSLTLILIDMLGRQVYHSHFHNALTVNMNRLIPGPYIIQIKRKETGEQMEKLIIKN